jgi:single-stranded DNA-specific DHH superfamily exonuclease
MIAISTKRRKSLRILIISGLKSRESIGHSQKQARSEFEADDYSLLSWDDVVDGEIRGAANITTHARNLTTTARRTDETRKTARQLKAERKAEQAAQRAEQTKQEKGKKRREIEKRMEALRKELGDKAFGMLEEEMEGDWDEEVFDRAMDKVLAAGLDDVSRRRCRSGM